MRDYLVTATALTAMDMAIWSRAKALELAKRFPEIHARLDVQLAQNVKILLGRVHTVSEGRVAQRLARVLLELAERHGEPRPPGVAILPAADAPGPRGAHRAPRSTPPAGCWPTGSTRAC